MKGAWVQLGLWWMLCLSGAACFAAVDVDLCAVCGKPIVDVYYSYEDHVTLEKRHVCKNCEQAYPECFVCGLPADTNAVGFVGLPDQRVLCARDAKTAVLREEEGLRLCQDVRDALDRLFSRFTSFPETNVTVHLVDRVHLQDLFKLAGNDYHCPNVWGLTQSSTNRQRLEHSISLMSGLPLAWFQATCAHEYAHTWVAEHVSPARRDALNRDAEEGFCELVSYLFMNSLNNEAQKALILRNAYTRGQINLFVAAQKSYGFNDILDWMMFGADDRLSAGDPGRVRKLAQTRPPAPMTLTLLAPPSRGPAPQSITLKAIFWDPQHPSALINDRTFRPQEERVIRVGSTNVLVRCMGISSDSVRLRVAGSDHEQLLRLK